MSGIRISDVAARAGVSAMTVSRVMNNRGAVKPETREAVLRAVEALGYAPNVAARSLALGGLDRIGLIWSNPSAGYLSEFLLGALEGVRTHGGQLLVEQCGDDAESEVAAVRRLAAGGARGLVLPPPHGESVAALAEADRLGLKVVVVAAGSFRPEALGVRIDDRAAAAAMTRRLLDLGHRRIGLITGAANQSASAERLIGFQSEIDACPGAEAVIEAGDFTYRSGLDAAGRLLDRPGPPTAIFASNDDMALGAVAVAHQRGLDVPRDLTVVGFDDIPMATAVWPPLTTIRQPVARMAAEAVALLVGGSNDGDIVFPHALIERGTSAPPA
ncbi:MAG: LacI family DNA-binding transcriptional regulator [Caulobacteraceae bacterium]|nr:LacI family DNA-binding transcriptional regulator [Caulobacteraceae bacterium]